MSDDFYDWGQWRASDQMLKDLPLLKPEVMDLLKQEQKRLYACLIPINRKVAAVHLAKLRTRYPERFIPKRALKLLVHDDLNDLAEYPEKLVERACTAWRGNPAHEWAPKSIAQLMECVGYEFRIMKTELHRVCMLLSLPCE